MGSFSLWHWLILGAIVWWLVRLRNKGDKTPPPAAAAPVPEVAAAAQPSGSATVLAPSLSKARPARIARSIETSDTFVVLDLETTGLSAAKHEIIEIGALKVRWTDMKAAKLTAQTFQTLVRPINGVPKRITQITGLTEEVLLAQGTHLHPAILNLRDFIEDLPIVAYNASFDRGFLQAAFEKSELLLANEFVCALAMARQAWPDRKSHKLAELAKSVKAGDAHRALGDCQRALVVYGAAVEAVGRRR